jgi:hypothetical protein
MVQDDPATTSHEARLSLLFSGFDLERLRFESAFEIAPKAGHFEPDNTGIFRGATAFEPGRVLVSNQHAALILDDVKRMPGTLEVQSRESVATILTIVDDGLGRCRPRLDLDADLSLNGPTRGFHGSGLNERARLVESLGFLGPDEGLSDETVLFLLVNDGHGGNNDPDSDEQIYAAAINSARRGRLEGSLVNAPRRVSTHRDSPSTSVSDPVLDPRLSLMRDGRAALILYRQAESSGQGPGIALNGVLFKTSPASGFPGSRFSLEARLDGAPSDSSRSFVGSNGLELRAVSDMALPRGPQPSLRAAERRSARPAPL